MLEVLEKEVKKLELMVEREHKHEAQGDENCEIINEIQDVSEFGFEQAILSFLRRSREGAFESIRIDGSLKSGFLQDRYPLEQRNVDVDKSGAPEDLEQFQQIVKAVRRLVSDQRSIDTLLNSRTKRTT